MPQAALVESDPVVILVYTLMRRGSVTAKTMEQVIHLVRDGAPATDVNGPRDEVLLETARDLCEEVLWYW